jgi:hypothetical protein
MAVMPGDKLTGALARHVEWCIEIVKRSRPGHRFSAIAAALGGRTNLRSFEVRLGFGSTASHAGALPRASPGDISPGSSSLSDFGSRCA